jgi:hypothetical protein
MRHEIDWYGRKKYQIEAATSACLWYTPGYDPLPIRWVLVRDAFGNVEPTAFLARNQATTPRPILHWFITGRSVEVTIQEAWAHMDLETQLQWLDLAIQRATLPLLGLFSLVTLLAHHLSPGTSIYLRAPTCYVKIIPTFSDVVALVCYYLWINMKCVKPPDESGVPANFNSIFSGVVETIVYAAKMRSMHRMEGRDELT